MEIGICGRGACARATEHKEERQQNLDTNIC